jgi:hypothetical protein
VRAVAAIAAKAMSAIASSTGLTTAEKIPQKFFSYVCIFAAVAGTFGYLWLNFDSLTRLALDKRSVAVPVMDTSDTGVTQKDIQSFKRQIAESLQFTTENIEAQKADLKKLSDQVAALSMKIDTMQGVFQSSISAKLEIRPGLQQSAVPVSPAPPAERRKLAAPKMTGLISVGGAPLAAAADR